MQNQIVIGKIVAPHGVRGDIRILPLTEKPEQFLDLDYLLLAEHETSAQAAPAAATPRWRKNWPTKRLVLAVAGIIGLIGVVVLSIWGSVLPDSHEGLTAIGNLNSYYHLTWLTLPLQAMLLFGGVGSIFYDRLRHFWHEDVLNDGKEKRL